MSDRTEKKVYFIEKSEYNFIIDKSFSIDDLLKTMDDDTYENRLSPITKSKLCTVNTKFHNLLDIAYSEHYLYNYFHSTINREEQLYIDKELQEIFSLDTSFNEGDCPAVVSSSTPPAVVSSSTPEEPIKYYDTSIVPNGILVVFNKEIIRHLMQDKNNVLLLISDIMKVAHSNKLEYSFLLDSYLKIKSPNFNSDVLKLRLF